MRIRPILLGALGVLMLLVVWELGATLIQLTNPKNSAIIWPHLAEVFTVAFPAIATVDTTGSSSLVPGTAEPSYLGAVEVLSGQAWVTIQRVLLGLLLGVFIGVVLGLLIHYSKIFRSFFSPILQVLRQIPLFALTLLFILWFGGTDAGIITFVTFGSSLMMMVATQEAVGMVPEEYLRYARTLGASPLRVFRTVVIPAVLPPLSATILVVVGLSWAMVMAAEFLGTQAGLGRMIMFFQLFQLTDRMVVVAGVLVALAVASHFLLTAVFRRTTRWVAREAR